MSSVIDYFCLQYDLSLGDLAEYLNIKQPQINDWKRGRRNIPEKHKQAMYDLFSIPIGKQYLLEIDKADLITKLEIDIIYLKHMNSPSKDIELIKEKLELEKDLLKIKEYLQIKNTCERKQLINKILNM